MVKIKFEYPLQEYAITKKSPVYVELQGNRFVVPVSYNGDKQKFVDELFSKDEIVQTYPKGERKYAYVEIDGYKVIAPHRWASGKLDFQIINRMMDMAILKYNNAARIAKMHRKSTSRFSSNSLISLDNRLIDKQIDGIAGFLGERVRGALHKINEFELNVGEKGVRHTINYGARVLSGVLAAPVILAAAVSQKNQKASQKLTKIAKLILNKKIWQEDLLDKTKSQETAEKLNELADKTCDRITLLIERFSSRFANWSRKNSPQAVASTANYIAENKKKTALYTAITTSFIGGGAALSGNNGSKSNSSENQITVTDTHQTLLPDTKLTFTPIKYTITDRQSFEDAFNASLPLIHRALLATEWFSDNGYSDNNNAASNTLGVGLWWFPENYAKDRNPQSVEWEHTKDFLKKHPSVKVNYEEAMELTEGWFRYRNTLKDKEHPKTVLDNMYERLKGCELAPHELAAIASVYYNDESCGRRLCSFVHDNYQNKFACAEYISKLQPKDASFDKGIQKRHCHEALYYLNYNNYCAKVLDFNVNSGVNSKGRFVVNTAPTSLENEEYQGFLSELQNHKLGVQTDILVEKMCKFAPPSGINFTTVSLRDFIGSNASNAKKMTQIAHYDNSTTVHFSDVVKSTQQRA